MNEGYPPTSETLTSESSSSVAVKVTLAICFSRTVLGAMYPNTGGTFDSTVSATGTKVHGDAGSLLAMLRVS